MKKGITMRTRLLIALLAAALLSFIGAPETEAGFPAPPGFPSPPGLPAPPGVDVRVNGRLPVPPGVNISIGGGTPETVIYREKHHRRHRDHDHEDHGRRHGHDKHKNHRD